MKRSFCLGVFVVVLTTMLSLSASAQRGDNITNIGIQARGSEAKAGAKPEAFQDYTDFSAFQSAFGKPLETITFTEVPVGTTVTNQYLGSGVRFTDGNDVTMESSSFVRDGIGVNGHGRVHLHFMQPTLAIGSFFPGALTIEIYTAPGGTLLYTSSDFAGAGTGFFGGVVGDTEFTYVVLRDWVDDFVYLDDIVIGFAPSCPFMVITSDANTLDNARQFRDTVLAGSEIGQLIIDVYYYHSPEVARILLNHPLLSLRGAVILKATMPGIRFLLGDEKGKDTVISPMLANRIQRLFADISAEASDGLANTLCLLSVMVDACKGMRISEVWQALKEE